MRMSVFDCKPFKNDMHIGKEKGQIETVVEVDMKMFQIDTEGMQEKIAFVFQAYGKFNNMFLLQTKKATDTESTFFIGDFDSIFNYLIELGVYKDDEKYQQRLARNLHKHFSVEQ